MVRYQAESRSSDVLNDVSNVSSDVSNDVSNRSQSHMPPQLHVS